MKLQLKADMPIREVKRQFLENFPYLKLEFYRKGHRPHQGSRLKEQVPDHLPLLEVTGVLKEGVLEFDPAISAGDLEFRLQHQFGLPAQVFRKSGELWLETIHTDELTLEQQNEMGKASVRKYRYNLNTLFL